MSQHDLRCPGQSMMFYKPGDIYDVGCPSCGKPVEFWKDDARRTCTCGHRFANPKRDLGCLEYCQYAEACMPEMFEGDNLRAIYRDRLIAAIRARLNPDSELLRRLSIAGDLAEETAVEEGGDPKTTIAAAILSNLTGPDEGGLEQGQAREILAKIGTESEVIERICVRIWGSGSLSVAPNKSQANPES